jgi:uncharacterized membrane protein YoaK (UPF0700 family)
MSALIPCFFFIVLAVTTYHTAKRQGRWSWLQFAVVVVSLVLIPILILLPLEHWPWLLARPGWFMLVAISLIVGIVGALCYALNRFWPLPKKPVP